MNIEKKLCEYEILFAKYTTLLIILRHLLLWIINFFFREYIYLALDTIILCLITPGFILLFYLSNFNFSKLGKITSFLYLALLILYCAVSYSQNLIAIFSYVFLFPLSFLLFFEFKKTFILSASILLIFPVSYLLDNYTNIDRNFPKYYAEVINVFTIIFSLILFFCYLYYFVQINKLRTVYNYTINNEVTIDGFYFIKPKTYKIHFSNILQDKPETLPIDESFYKLLFENIESYMKINEPWKSPGYNLTQLTKDLNSNQLYVSSAINKYSKNNFKTYLNEFRLNAFIESVKNKNEQFFLKEIYLNIGFDNQVTFNRVFKNKFLITPQEYLEQINK
ncbi:helix-turn-helix domain-containing protein [Chryseobacterium sp. RP-3-3]|uniref:Helix-turn-helix domain-containing protein n=1 Tax=Chryseobacterium antibioticum TaxID=2728847 RepID=A0A7Y0ARM0_9FLAO|nr:helix-turn-helix domain-containing protein [Chryseobacterium antibioticum]NML72187.1 helix-turn-helix domain-containing protein [Chryseobacterium antibioticum]